MDKFSFIALWDAYGGLLTEVRREITNLYFNLDLTVSEIAEEKGISRQAVSECLKQCKTTLSEYEEKLHFVEKMHEVSLDISFKLTDIGAWADKFSSAHPEFAGDIEKLKSIVGGDYSERVNSVLENPEAQKTLFGDYTKEVYGRKKDGEE